MDQVSPGSFKFRKKPFAVANGLKLKRPVCQPLAKQLTKLAQQGTIPTREFFRTGAVFDCVLPKNKFRLVPSPWPKPRDSFRDAVDSAALQTTSAQEPVIDDDRSVNLPPCEGISIVRFLPRREGAVICVHHGVKAVVGESGPQFGKTAAFSCGCPVAVVGDHKLSPDVFCLKAGSGWKYTYKSVPHLPAVRQPVVQTKPLDTYLYLPNKTSKNLEASTSKGRKAQPKSAPGSDVKQVTKSNQIAQPKVAPVRSVPKPEKTSYAAVASVSQPKEAPGKSHSKETSVPVTKKTDIVEKPKSVSQDVKTEQQNVPNYVKTITKDSDIWVRRKRLHNVWNWLKDDKTFYESQENPGGFIEEFSPEVERPCSACGREAIWVFFKLRGHIPVDEDDDQEWVEVERCAYHAGIVRKVPCKYIPGNLPYRGAFKASPRITNPENSYRQEANWWAARIAVGGGFDAHGRAYWKSLGMATSEIFENPVLSMIVDYVKTAKELKDLGHTVGCINNRNGPILRDMQDVPGNRQRVFTSDAEVHGPGYCWMKLYWLATSGDFSRARKASEICHITREKSWVFKVDIQIDWDWTDDDDVHIFGVKQTNKDGTYHITPEFDEERATSCLDFITSLETELCGDVEAEENTLVGSAVELIDTSLRVNGPEIAKLNAIEMFNNEINSMPTTDFRMNDSTRNIIQKYIGVDFRTRQRKTNHNDHLALEISRDFIRNELMQRMPHNSDYTRTLHVGSTAREIGAWSSHTGHDFVLNMAESKDVGRVYSDLVNMIGRKFSEMTIPSLTSKKGNSTHLVLNDLDEALSFLQTTGRKRFFTSPEQVAGTRYDVLMMEDCVYDMTESELAGLFDSTGAKIGYSVVFAPDVMVYKDVQPSRMYKYEEYYPSYEDLSDIIDKIWPSIAVFGTVVVPPSIRHHFAEHLHNFIRDAATKGWEKFKHLVQGIASSSYPWETLAGSIFDIAKLRPALIQVFRLFNDLCEKYFKRVSIVWKGLSNGYDHNLHTWKSHLFNRRIARASGLFLDSEVVARVGEIWLIKYSTSTGQSPITYSLEVPLDKQVVYLADVEKSFNRSLGRFDENMSYEAFNAKDFFMIHNWGAAEPVQSLEINVICTMVNRVRNGLSVASNVMVEPMNLFDSQIQRFSMAILMDLYQKKEVQTLISGNKELATAYTTNLQRIAEKIAKFGIVFATGGLALPFFYIFKYLLEGKPDTQFVTFPEEAKIIRIPGKVRKDSITSKTLLSKMHVSMPHKEMKAKKSCAMCQMMAEGIFSEDGNVANGQEWYCEKSEVDSVHEIGITASEMPAIIGTVRDAKNWHIAQNAHKVSQCIRDLEHFLEGHLTGVEKKVTIDMIRGGPGTGKTEVIKAYVTYVRKYGENCAISMPFKELSKDYVETTVLGQPGKHTFEADTTWYTLRHQNMTTLIVDECTAMDWDIIRCQAIYLGVNKIVLVGDPDQTHLNSEAGEGTDPTRSALIDWGRVPTHDLIWNYRLDAWRVKYLNWKFGYRMRARRSDSMPIRFIQKDTYLAMVANGELQMEKESVFAHQAAPIIFGKNSSAGDTEVTNMSVRTTQGKTYKGKHAVSCSQLDDSVMRIAGMMNVAISRSKDYTFFVFAESEHDPVVVWAKSYLMVDSPENVDRISHQLWKEREEVVTKVRLTPEEKIVDNKIRSMKEKHNAVIVDHRIGETDTTCDMIEPVKISREFPPENDEPPDNPYPLWDFMKEAFNFCFFEVMFDTFGEQRVKEKLYPSLLEVYNDDHLMERPSPKYTKHTNLFSRMYSLRDLAREPWTQVDGKATPRLKWCLQFAKAHFTEPVVVTVDGKWINRPAFLDKSNDDVRWSVLFDKHHISAITLPDKLCRQKGLEVNTNLSPLLFMEGKLVHDWEESDLEGVHTSSRRVKIIEPDNPFAVPIDRDTAAAVVLRAPDEVVSLIGFRRELEGVLGEDEAVIEVVPDQIHDWISDDSIPPATYNRRLLTAFQQGLLPWDVNMFRHGRRPTLDMIENPAREIPISPPDSPRNLDLDFVEVMMDDEYNQVAGVVITNKPTIKPAKVFEMDRAEYRLAYTKAFPTCSWVIDHNIKEVDLLPRKTPLRLGTDAYKLVSFLDPSSAWTRSNMINEAGPVLGNTIRNNITLNLPGFCFDRTKAGKLKAPIVREYRSMTPGYGCHFGSSPVESLVASQRVGKIGMKPQLTQESKKWAEDVAETFYRNNWVHNWLADPLEWNLKIQEGLQASRERNYHKRALALQAKDPTGRLILVASNKIIEKVKGEPDIFKRGQLLLQSPPHINRQYISLWRATNKLVKMSAKDHFFMDDYEDTVEFKKRMTRAIRDLPGGARFGIFDLKECDSQQGPVSLHIEKTFYKLVLKEFSNMEDYYQVREALPFIMHGVFTGKTNMEKPSGALDTKPGNTTISGALTEQAFYGYGPKVKAGKGDDGLHVQVGLQENYEAVKLIKAYTGITIVTKIGDGGEFIGTVVNRHGMFSDIAKSALKICMKRSRDVTHFQQQQMSIRELVKEVQDAGIVETIHFGREGTNYSPQFFEACLAFLNSVGHISEEQWLGVTDKRKETKFFPNTATGPTLL